MEILIVEEDSFSCFLSRPIAPYEFGENCLCLILVLLGFEYAFLLLYSKANVKLHLSIVAFSVDLIPVCEKMPII